ncbi:neuromedin-U receptor 2-like [Tetranychus urticae]|uniref:G-protein coupled receptors family 1 profile domain-containing protein n=1 Tax=Tetranychus urticae TaxID=32264 RepID=T1KLI3_TETUR|nr:neuromedin-U receptor 2-like [Tetranychus urticae]
MNSTNLVDIIEATLGPSRAICLPWLILLTFVYSLIFILGVIGNTATILVILRFKYMQSVTNLYLLNLAIADLLTLCAAMPLELYQLWHQYPWELGGLPCLLKVLIPETTANASILTLVAFTLERYSAICGSPKTPPPNINSSSSTRNRFTRNTVLIWLLGLLGAVPLALYTRINYLYIDDEPLIESAWCGLPFNDPDRTWETIMLTSTIIFFIFPLLIICLLYYFIAITLKKATRLDPIGNIDIHLNDQRCSRKIMQSRKIVIRLLVAIVIAFTICWTPFHAQRLLFLYVSLYSEWSNKLRSVNQILFLLAGVFYYLNSSINPILYSVMSTRFRVAFSLYINGLFNGARSADKSGGGGRGNNSDNSLILNLPNGKPKLQWRSPNFMDS